MSPEMTLNDNKFNFMRKVYSRLTDVDADGLLDFTEAKFEAAVACYMHRVFQLIQEKNQAVLHLVEPHASLEVR